MIKTYDEALAKIAERTVSNYNQLRRDKTQRRVSFTDAYGIEYLRQGDAGNPAKFYVSISPDFVYYERFALKLQVMPYVSSVSGINLNSLTVGDTELTFNGSGSSVILPNTSTLSESGTGSLSPNPHTHNASGGSGSPSYGLHFINTTSTTWRITIGGVDVSPYFMAQQDGYWINGTGLYPNDELTSSEDFYDVLAAACDMYAEGDSTSANNLLKPEMKEVCIYSDAPFQVATMVYIKFSTTNR